MMLCSQAECDFTSPKFCKDIITNGSFGPVCNKMNCDKAAFLRDSLEISKKGIHRCKKFAAYRYIPAFCSIHLAYLLSTYLVPKY